MMEINIGSNLSIGGNLQEFWNITPVIRSISRRGFIRYFQQKWISTLGKEEWRLIPLINEEDIPVEERYYPEDLAEYENKAPSLQDPDGPLTTLETTYPQDSKGKEEIDKPIEVEGVK